KPISLNAWAVARLCGGTAFTLLALAQPSKVARLNVEPSSLANAASAALTMLTIWAKERSFSLSSEWYGPSRSPAATKWNSDSTHLDRRSVGREPELGSPRSTPYRKTLPLSRARHQGSLRRIGILREMRWNKAQGSRAGRATVKESTAPEFHRTLPPDT